MISKAIKIILILGIILAIFNNYNVQAITDPITNPDYYNPTDSVTQETELMKMGGEILGIINTIGVVLSVIILMIIGIKYMLGSVEEKAEYKKSMMAYIIGALLLFSATTIPNIIYILTYNNL
ncbi:MAG: TrbC/VirB2 family protein [Clostridia bacterium]|nr:TrbC/VirB2 family protein [Clostridia bacterium]